MLLRALYEHVHSPLCSLSWVQDVSYLGALRCLRKPTGSMSVKGQTAPISWELSCMIEALVDMDWSILQRKGHSTDCRMASTRIRISVHRGNISVQRRGRSICFHKASPLICISVHQGNIFLQRRGRSICPRKASPWICIRVHRGDIFLQQTDHSNDLRKAFPYVHTQVLSMLA